MTATTSPDAPVRVEYLDDGAVLTLTRPAKLNTITKPMLLGLSALIDELEASGKRLLVITGEGTKAFCAGTDLGEAQRLSKPERSDKSRMARELLARLSRSKLVSVAAVNGLAFGGGLEVAMCCMFRVAAAHATFSLPEIKLGVLPAYGGTQFLPSLVGPARALDMMLTGRVVPSDEALSMGLINRAVPAGGDVVGAALAYAREITKFSPTAIAGIRRCVAAFGEVTDNGLLAEDALVRQVGDSDDAREGVAAFLEKRPAVFTGR